MYSLYLSLLHNQGIESLVNCVASGLVFTDTTQKHTCQGWKEDIQHVSRVIRCETTSAQTEVDDHEEDNWCPTLSHGLHVFLPVTNVGMYFIDVNPILDCIRRKTKKKRLIQTRVCV